LCVGSFVIMFSSLRLSAKEPFACPDSTDFSEKFYRSEEKLDLQVPQSFEGRTAKDERKINGVELFERVRFERTDGKVELRGTATVFDFDYVKDKLDLQIYKSRGLKPGSNTCMDCHGGKLSRTTVTVGQETQELIPKPIVRGNIKFTLDDAAVESAHITLNHWLNPRIMATADYKAGELHQAGISLNSVAAGFGLLGNVGSRFFWNGKVVLSKTESYKSKKTLTGKLTWAAGKRLKLSVGGGAFLDGYTHFGTDMSELGVMTVNLEKNDPELLPSLFTRLKKDRFGYLQTAIQYDYPF